MRSAPLRYGYGQVDDRPSIPAAGVAGIIKTSLALHHKVLPATLHADAGRRASGIGRHCISTRRCDLGFRGPEPRRAAVNAFGFGGINAHAILEEYVAGAPA